MSGTPKPLSLRFLLFLGALLTAGMLIPSRFAVTLTPSTEYRVFFLKLGPQMEDLKKGDYVLFEFSSEYIDRGTRHKAIKEIACPSGDVLSTSAQSFYCNGRAIGVAKDLSLKGEALPRLVYNGRIPEDKIFVTGQHRDSFDSRYFGFLKKEEVKAVAYPLF